MRSWIEKAVPLLKAYKDHIPDDCPAAYIIRDLLKKAEHESEPLVRVKDPGDYADDLQMRLRISLAPDTWSIVMRLFATAQHDTLDAAAEAVRRKANGLACGETKRNQLSDAVTNLKPAENLRY